VIPLTPNMHILYIEYKKSWILDYFECLGQFHNYNHLDITTICTRRKGGRNCGVPLCKHMRIYQTVSAQFNSQVLQMFLTFSKFITNEW
jgi:hypothetical protein